MPDQTGFPVASLAQFSRDWHVAAVHHSYGEGRSEPSVMDIALW
ncbi:hypothetical protein [Tritonibacter sp. SIMBA_163]